MLWWPQRCTPRGSHCLCAAALPLHTSCRSCTTSGLDTRAVSLPSDARLGVAREVKRLRRAKHAAAYRGGTAATTTTPPISTTITPSARMHGEDAVATTGVDQPSATTMLSQGVASSYEGHTLAAHATHAKVLPLSTVVYAPGGPMVTSEMACSYLIAQQRLHQMQRLSSFARNQSKSISYYMKTKLPSIVHRLGWNATLARVVLESAVVFRLQQHDVSLVRDAAAYLHSLPHTRSVTAIDATARHTPTPPRLTEHGAPEALSSAVSRLAESGRFALLLAQLLRWQAAQAAFIRSVNDGSWHSFTSNDILRKSSSTASEGHSAAATMRVAATGTTRATSRAQDNFETTSCQLTQYYTQRLLPDILDDLRVLCSSSDGAMVSASEREAFSLALAACNKALAADVLQIDAAPPSPSAATTAATAVQRPAPVRHLVCRPHLATYETGHAEHKDVARDHTADGTAAATAAFVSLRLRDFASFLSSFVASARRVSERRLRSMAAVHGCQRFSKMRPEHGKAQTSSDESSPHFDSMFQASSLLPVLHFVLHSRSFVCLLTHEPHTTTTTTDEEDSARHPSLAPSEADDTGTLPQVEARLVDRLVRDVVELFYIWQQWLPYCKSYHISAFTQIYVRALTRNMEAANEPRGNVPALLPDSTLLARVQATLQMRVRAVLEGTAEMAGARDSHGSSRDAGRERLAVDLTRLRPAAMFVSLCECLIRCVSLYTVGDLASQLPAMTRLHMLVQRWDTLEGGSTAGGVATDASRVQEVAVATERCIAALNHRLSTLTLQLKVKKVQYKGGDLCYTSLWRGLQTTCRTVAHKGAQDVRYTSVPQYMMAQFGLLNFFTPHLAAPTELLAIVDAVEQLRAYPLRGLHRCVKRAFDDLRRLADEPSGRYLRLLPVGFRGASLHASYNGTQDVRRVMLKRLCSLVHHNVLRSDELHAGLRRLAASLPDAARHVGRAAADTMTADTSDVANPKILVNCMPLPYQGDAEGALTLDEIVETLLSTVARDEFGQLTNQYQLCLCCAARIVAAWPVSPHPPDGDAAATAASQELAREHYCVRYLLPLYAACRFVWLGSRHRSDPFVSISLLSNSLELELPSILEMLHTTVRVLHDVLQHKAAICRAALIATQNTGPLLTLGCVMETVSLLLCTANCAEARLTRRRAGRGHLAGAMNPGAEHTAEETTLEPCIMTLLQAVVQHAAQHASAATITRSFADFFDRASPVWLWSASERTCKDVSNSLGGRAATVAISNALEQARLSRCVAARTVLRWIYDATPAVLASLPRALLHTLTAAPEAAMTGRDARATQCRNGVSDLSWSSSLLTWALLPCSDVAARSSLFVPAQLYTASAMPPLPRCHSFDTLLWCTQQLYLTNPSFLAPAGPAEGVGVDALCALQDEIYASFTRLVTPACAMDSLVEFLGLCAFAEARQAIDQSHVVAPASAGKSLLQRCVAFLLECGDVPHRCGLVSEMLRRESVTDAYDALHYVMQCMLLLRPLCDPHATPASAAPQSASSAVQSPEMPASLLAIPGVRAALDETRRGRTDTAQRPHWCILLQLLTVLCDNVAPPQQLHDMMIMMNALQCGAALSPPLQAIALRSICSYQTDSQAYKGQARRNENDMRAGLNKTLQTLLMVVNAVQSCRTKLSGKTYSQVMWRTVDLVARRSALWSLTSFPRVSTTLLSQLIECISALRNTYLKKMVDRTVLRSLSELYVKQATCNINDSRRSVSSVHSCIGRFARVGLLVSSILPGSTVRLQYLPTVRTADSGFSMSPHHGATVGDEATNGDAMGMLLRWQFVRIFAGLSPKAWRCMLASRLATEQIAAEYLRRRSFTARPPPTPSPLLCFGDKAQPMPTEQAGLPAAARVAGAASAPPHSPSSLESLYCVTRTLHGLQAYCFLAYLGKSEVAEMCACQGPLSFLDFVSALVYGYALQTSELQRDNIHRWFSQVQCTASFTPPPQRVYRGEGYLAPGPATAMQGVLADTFLQSWLAKAWWVLGRLTTSDGLEEMLQAQIAADAAKSRRERQNMYDKGDGTSESHPAMRAARRYATVCRQRAAATLAGRSSGEYDKPADEGEEEDDEGAEMGGAADCQGVVMGDGEDCDVAMLDLEVIVNLLQLVDVLQPVLRVRQCRVRAAQRGTHGSMFTSTSAPHCSVGPSINPGDGARTTDTLLTCGLLTNVTPVQILQAILSSVQRYTQQAMNGSTPATPRRPRLEVRCYSAVLAYHANRARMVEMYDQLYGHGIARWDVTAVQGDDGPRRPSAESSAANSGPDYAAARLRALRLEWRGDGATQVESRDAVTARKEQMELDAQALQCVSAGSLHQACSAPCEDIMPRTRRLLAQLQSHDLCSLILLLVRQRAQGDTVDEARQTAQHARAAEEEVRRWVRTQPFFIALVDAYTDLLPSAAATDLLKVTEALLSVLQRGGAEGCEAVQRTSHSGRANDACERALSEALRHAICRLLAHIPGLAAHDTERFSQAQLFRLLYRLHAPQQRLHALPGEAAPDLTSLFAESLVAPEAVRAMRSGYVALYNHRRIRRAKEARDDTESVEAASMVADNGYENDLSGFMAELDEFVDEVEQETGDTVATHTTRADLEQQWQSFTLFMEHNTVSCPHKLLISLLDFIEATSTFARCKSAA